MKKIDLSVVMASSKSQNSEVHPSNVIRPDLDNIETDKQKDLEEYLKNIEKDVALQAEQCKKEATKKFFSHFSMDRQGKVTKLKDVAFDPLQCEVKPDVSKQPQLDSEIANMVDGAVVAHVNNKIDSVGHDLNSIFYAHFNRIEAYLGMNLLVVMNQLYF